MNQIWLLLGLKPDGFRAGLKQATDQTKAFEKGWKDLGKIFAAGGFTTLALGFLRQLVEHAKESKDQLDENTAAVVRFGNAWDQAKTTVMNGAVQAFGTVASWVEKGTIGLASLVYGADAAATALEETEGAAKKAFDDAQIKKLADAEAALAKGRRDRAMAAATDAEKLTILINEEVALREKVRDLEADKPAQQLAINELEAKQLEIKKVALEMTKDAATAEKKILEERQKAHDAALKVVAENRELMILEAKVLAGTINPEELKRLEILKLQAKQKLINAEIDELLAKKLAGTITPAEKARLGVLIQQVGAIDSQIAGLNKANAEIAAAAPLIESNIKKWEEFVGVINSTGRGNRDLSDAELQRKIAQTRRDLAQRQGQSLGTYQGQSGTPGLDFFTEAQKSNLAQAEAELRLRQKTRANASIFGEAQAFQQSGLTEQRFKEILGTMTSADRADRTNRTLDEINRTVQDSNAQSKRLADLLDKGVNTVIQGNTG